MTGDDTYTTVTTAEQVTEEILSLTEGVIEGWYNDGKVDWEDVWDRIEGSHLDDGTVLNLGNNTDTPAMRKIQRHIRQWLREGG